MEKRKNWLVLCLTAGFLLVFALWSICKADDARSVSERRALAQRPELTAKSVWDGTFMTKFETYTLDQFPLRDTFRSLKAHVQLDVLRQKDNNGIYVADGYAAKLDYPLNEDSVEHALARFRFVYERYLQGTDAKIYFAAIPDKNYFLAEKYGYPALDYEEFIQKFADGMEYAQTVDLTDVLTLGSYYRTDIHWRQEAILPAAQRLAEAMGADWTDGFEAVTLDAPFCGVYCGQSALDLPPDALTYLTNDTLRACTVYDYETDTTLPVYDLDAAGGDDAYALFLSGSKSLLTLENPNAKTERELVVFRDSFGSSLVPLLAEGYAKITLVDIRYVAPERLGMWLTFDNQDVLFLYSTPVLNNSETLK